MLSVRGARLIIPEGLLDHDTVKKVHFGGFSDDEEEKEDEVYHSDPLISRKSPNQSLQPDRKKSKAEVMAEVIAKSKAHKVFSRLCTRGYSMRRRSA